MQPSQGSTLSQVHSRKHWLPRWEKKLQSSCCLDRGHLLLLLGTRSTYKQRCWHSSGDHTDRSESTMLSSLMGHSPACGRYK